MSKKWGSDVPHVRYVAEQNSDMWFLRDVPVMPVGFSVIAKSAHGSPCRDETNFPAFITRFDEMHPSAWDPIERAKVMDGYGIDMAVLYPNLGFVGPDIYRLLSDSTLEFQVEIARAYNDWILDWATQRPQHFIPMACIPYWDVPSAIKEVERCAELGHRGFVMTGVPDLHGEPLLPDPHWYPLWSAVQATGWPVSFHAGGGVFVAGKNPVEPRASLVGRNSTVVFMTTQTFMMNGQVVADLLTSGILPKFPDLKFIAVESGIGWIPFVLESLDFHAKQYRVSRDQPEFTEPPSFYFRRQVFANSWFEKVTDFHLDRIGADSLLFETDYPHPTCLIEDEVEHAIKEGMAEIDDESRTKILSGNAAKLFGV